MRKMTKKEALRDFRENILPHLREVYESDGRVDVIARRLAWNDYTDSLHADGLITLHQCETWTNPW